MGAFIKLPEIYQNAESAILNKMAIARIFKTINMNFYKQIHIHILSEFAEEPYIPLSTQYLYNRNLNEFYKEHD